MIRLQQKILSQEKQLQSLQEQLAAAPEVGAAAAGGGGGGPLRRGRSVHTLPQEPHKFEMRGHTKAINALRFHHAYSLLASSSDDTAIKLWDYDTGKIDRTLKGHTSVVNDISFSPDGKLLASCSADLTIKVWDIETTFRCVKTLHGHEHNVSGVAWMSAVAFYFVWRKVCRLSCGGRSVALSVWPVFVACIVA